MLCFFSGTGCKCLQNYCKFCCSFHPASPFSMQPVEVYMLHSFSSEVYSFQQWRQIRRGKQSNICTFLSCITTICVFLFLSAFCIIIVYNGCVQNPRARRCFLIIFRRRTKMSKAISRRDFMKVTGVVGAAGLLAACGGNSSSTAASSSVASAPAASADESLALSDGPVSMTISWWGGDSRHELTRTPSRSSRLSTATSPSSPPSPHGPAGKRRWLPLSSPATHRMCAR